MEAIVERCCGLDVHQATVVACLLIGKPHEKPRKEVRTFPTVMRDLVALRDWLQANGCTHVGMESTGVYWMPVFAVLEGDFELIVGNARHIKNVPGRKTDVKDAEWIADLVRHGLIRKSFVPPKPLRQLRDLLRYRTKLVQSRSSERNRLLKLLETANIKLSSVVSDVFGVSGMAMLEALLEGSADAPSMARLARGRMRKKLPDLELALEGRIERHHRFLLRMQLERLKQAEQQISLLDAEIDAGLEPYAKEYRLLRTIPGIDRVAAAVIISEIGTDMSAFSSPHHLAAWVGVCPGSNESAGKRRRARTRKGNAHLRAHLVQAATSAARKRGTYYKNKYWRLKARCGPKRAQVAIAHKLIVACYHMLRNGAPFHDLGEAYLDATARRRTEKQLTRRLEALGYRVTLVPAA